MHSQGGWSSTNACTLTGEKHGLQNTNTLNVQCTLSVLGCAQHRNAGGLEIKNKDRQRTLKSSSGMPGFTVLWNQGHSFPLCTFISQIFLLTQGLEIQPTILAVSAALPRLCVADYLIRRVQSIRMRSHMSHQIISNEENWKNRQDKRSPGPAMDSPHWQ